MLNSTTRFSDRVDNYIKYRPHYPIEVIDYLKSENILRDDSIIADIGSGTGISTELFLRNGNTVYGVEPNKEMREAAERLLAGYGNFASITGTAEDSTLSSNSIDVITAGQAFHWFDAEKTKIEFRRILKTDGNIVLMWNVKKMGTNEFMNEYEKLLLKYCPEFPEVRHEKMSDDEVISMFFKYRLKIFPNYQMLDLEGFKGRLLSSSYAPTETDPNFEPMLAGMKGIFVKFNENGKIKFEYDTKIYTGSL
ncbi:MAG: class I SAM-dependent methyltransferase [Ignavibacteria bacterium]|nr:class I SAM-dependent methyltransferase [Ignavibacteria bacterium]